MDNFCLKWKINGDCFLSIMRKGLMSLKKRKSFFISIERSLCIIIIINFEESSISIMSLKGLTILWSFLYYLKERGNSFQRFLFTLINSLIICCCHSLYFGEKMENKKTFWKKNSNNICVWFWLLLESAGDHWKITRKT